VWHPRFELFLVIFGICGDFPTWWLHATHLRMAFYHLLTAVVNIPTGSPGRLILNGNVITNVPDFVQLSDQYFCGMIW